MTNANLKASAPQAFSLEALRTFIDHEADLLDSRRFEEWADLFAEDGKYWAPAQPGQESPSTHVSLFYDEKIHIQTRIRRLLHPKLHCQDPKSNCVRVISNFALEWISDDGGECRVRSKFIMLEDRPGADRRVYGGRYTHTVRRRGDGFEIVLKRADITNCDQSFPMLTQPF